MKALCHVLFYPTNYSLYIMTECTELTELRCNNMWLGVRFLEIEMKGRAGKCGWEAHRLSGSAGVCVCVLHNNKVNMFGFWDLICLTNSPKLKKH